MSCHFKVYIVAGGFNGDRLSSTETLLDGAGAWSSVGNLPMAMSHLRGLSFQNKVIMTGNNITRLKDISI